MPTHLKLDQEDANVVRTCQADTERQTLMENENQHLSRGNKFIEGLPLGFFDDNAMNNRVLYFKFIFIQLKFRFVKQPRNRSK